MRLVSFLKRPSRLDALKAQSIAHKPAQIRAPRLFCVQPSFLHQHRLCPESAGQGRSFSARVILANGVTIDVPAGIAPDALGAFIHAAMQIAARKGVSSR